MISSIVTAILPSSCILPVGEGVSERVSAYSLRSRLVFYTAITFVCATAIIFYIAFTFVCAATSFFYTSHSEYLVRNPGQAALYS